MTTDKKRVLDELLDKVALLLKESKAEKVESNENATLK